MKDDIDDLIIEYFKNQEMISFVEDIECLIKCGNCCWECAFLEVNGCSLEREERPPECRMYLCGDATEKYFEEE